MIEKALQTERGPVAYWTSADWSPARETLVFLHGLTADHTLFDRQLDAFPEYNLLIWDAPAHGKSRPYRDFSYANAAADLERILDETGIVSAVLIGQSMGGYISQALLLRAPHRVKAFVGIDTCPFGEGYYSASDKWWLRQVEWMAALYPLSLLKRSVAGNCSRTAWARENMLTALAPYGKRELCHLMGIGFAEFLVENRALDIRCPTLLLVGEYDRTGKVLQYCRAWTKRTGFPLVIIKDAAHNANADAPAAVNAAIRRFLETL